MSERSVRRALVVLGVSQVGLAGWQAASPGTFFDAFAAYGRRNDHYVRDVATLYFALGVALIVSAARASWRPPTLFFATAQYATHLANHLADLAEATPRWVGPANAVAIGLGALAFGLLLRMTWREEP